MNAFAILYMHILGKKNGQMSIVIIFRMPDSQKWTLNMPNQDAS